ncbi:esterase-like activity of phytase family protein [Sphingomonas aerolata]|uniref:esterase-like activity of phytase family protein n=1 Tax=Sphingomonas aerolata TaxID=185951 RepID=UPI002FE37055
MTLLSDGGNIVRFHIGDDWRPAGIGFAALPGGPGQGWSKRDRDSESLTIDAATGTAWVGFEYWNAVGRYAAGADGTLLARFEGMVRPRAMREWPDNGGPESMVRLRDGRSRRAVGDRAAAGADERGRGRARDRAAGAGVCG